MTGQDGYRDRLCEFVNALDRFHSVFGRHITHVGVFSAFIDESVSHPTDEHSIYTMAGYIGTVPGWSGFDQAWSAALAPLGVPYFHMVEYENAEKNPDGPYGRDPELSKTVFNNLIDVVRDYTEPSRQTIWPFALTFDMRNWDNLSAEVVAVLKDPYHALMRSLTQFVTAGCYSTDGQPTQVIFVFESAPTAELTGICTDAFNNTRQYAEWGDKLLSIEFAPKGRYRGNEAADMLAYDTRKHVRHLLEAGHPLNTKSKAWRYSTQRLLRGRAEMTHWVTDLSDATLRFEKRQPRTVCHGGSKPD
jgi:hypothetical protein